MTPYERVREEFGFPFELRPYQIDRVNEHCLYTETGFYWEPGCVDADTEYLSPTGWVRIADYAGGRVTQFDPNTGLATLVEPSRFINEPCDSMVRIKTKYGVDQMLSDGHRMLVYRGDRPHRWEDVPASLIYSTNEAYREGRKPSTTYGIPLRHTAVRATFETRREGIKGVSDEVLRLTVAVVADGHFGSPSNRCVVRLKKARKVERMHNLLQAAGVEYTCREQDTGTARGFKVFTFEAPIRVKEFDERFWESDPHQVRLLAHEVTYWDSSYSTEQGSASFSSTSKASADFVQYLWAATGRVAGMYEDKRSAKYTGGKCYQVSRRGSNRPSGLLHIANRDFNTVTREAPVDGRKYCFTVPSGYLVLRRNGCVFTTGNSGKTAGSTHWMLHTTMNYGVSQWILLMPPILITQWGRWLSSVRSKRSGKPPEVALYQGTPAQRSKVNLAADFILMSYGIFKNDYDRLGEFFEGRSVGLLCDEAHAVKNIESQTSKAVRHFTEDRALGLLTGTPTTKPGDAYAYIKMIAPAIYRNKRQFDRLHIGSEDAYGKVTEWVNLDLLRENLSVQTTRVIRREVQAELPPCTYTPIVYDLHPSHIKLYRRIAEERLVEFANGREIDAISTQALYAALQQIIVNWGEFADDPSLTPAGLELVEEVMEELGDSGKLVVVANFIRSNRYLLQALKHYNAVAVYGEVSPKDKQKAIERFVQDQACRIIILQPQSAGFGVDGLQHVSADMLFLEAPTTAPPFHQTVARLDRDGQSLPVNCRVAIAQGTVQERMFKTLLENDATINAVQGGYKDLREAIFGK